MEEFEIGAKPIEGVSTSTTAFIGGAKKGPILKPTLVTSWSQFEAQFGGLVSTPRIYLGYAVDSFFRNGGKRAYIVRVASSTAAKANYTIRNKDGNEAIIAEALETGAAGNNIVITTANKLSPKTDVFKKSTAVSSISGKEITVSDAEGFEAGDVIRVLDATQEENATIFHIEGNVITLEGNLVNTYAAPITLRTADMEAGDKEVRLTTASRFFKGSIVHISDGNNDDYSRVEKVEGKKLILDTALANAYVLDPSDTDALNVTVVSMEFDLTIKKGSVEESYTWLTIDSRHPRYFARVIDSTLVSLKLSDPPALAASANNLLPEILNSKPLTGGIEDDLTNIDYASGIAPLEREQEISLVAMPGQTTQGLQQKLIEHCEKIRYRFCILDSFRNAEVSGPGSVKAQRDKLSSEKGFAALYYPWVQIKDPVSKELIYLPPSGAIAGIYARSDGERGVHKAPANENVAGSLDLERTVTVGEQEILNPTGINVIRFFPGRGRLVWGARTIASDPLWKYINVRRLFIYVEESIERATQWVVFEPNNDKLWGRVRATITEFLTRVWRDGALMGTKPEEAFFVKCDRTTMTQADIDNGRLICVIGISPVKPAEFVIFRIAQWAGGSEISE
ncbi:MAG: phage tail sheath family protein [Methanosarcinaceae archaeon]